MGLSPSQVGFLWQSHSGLFTFVPFVTVFLSDPWGHSSGPAYCAALSRVPPLPSPSPPSWVIKLESGAIEGQAGPVVPAFPCPDLSDVWRALAAECR